MHSPNQVSISMAQDIKNSTSCSPAIGQKSKKKKFIVLSLHIISSIIR